MDISLRLYFEQLDSLIESKQVDEAIAHCRHILSYYPKNLEAYRLLGKALLDNGRHGDAADIFQRVLSAVPDDFIAHVGMAIVREDEANIATACWHMERAYEVNPSNSAIQEELRRLYGRRDGITPPKARLTRGALARLYSQGELFVQAEAEIKAALNEDPERVDLTCLLAHVYWRNDQRAQAAEACSAVLQKLPYSLEANRILADIFNLQGRPQDAAAFKQRVEALDPYEAFAVPGANGQGAAEVKPEAVRIPRLDYVPGMDDSRQPDWMASLGASMGGEPAAAPAPAADFMSSPFGANSPFAADLPGASDMPDWLTPGGAPAAPAESAPDLGAGPDWLSSAAAPPTAPAADMPGWMKGMAPPGTGPLASPAPAAPAADWMSGFVDDSGAAPESEMPDWMKPAASGAEGDSNAAEAVSKILAGPITPEPAAPAADVPDWMQGAVGGGAVAGMAASATPGPETSATRVPGPGSLNTNETPDWMKDIQPTPGTSPLGGGGRSVKRMTDWLKPPPGYVEPTPAAPAAPSTEAPTAIRGGQSAPATETPAWMHGIDTEAPTGALGAQAAPQPAPDLPAWMQGAASPPAAEPPAETPDWMRAAAPAASQAEPPSEVPAWMRRPSPAEAPVTPSSGDQAAPAPDWMQSEEAGAPAAEPAADIPDWMKGMAQTPADAPGGGEAADWMKEATEPMPPAGIPDWLQSAAQDEPPAADLTAQVPDWMQGIEPEAPAAEAAPAETVPDWMKDMAATPADAGPAPAETAAQIPDWIRSAAAEPPAPAAEPAAEIPAWMAGVAAGLPAAPAPAAEAPEWMTASGPPAEPPSTSFVPPSGGRPDWLAQMEAEADAYEASVAPPAPAGAKPPAEEKRPAAPADLPDFLQMASPEAVAAANTPPTEEELEAENWLADAVREPRGEEVTPAQPAIDMPDWLKAMAPPAADAVPAAASPAPGREPGPAAAPEKDLSEMSPDEALKWLEGLALAQGAKPEELVSRREPDAEPPAPEWIREPVESVEEAAPELPAWAQAPSEPAPMDTVTHWLADKKKKVPEWLRQPGDAAAAPPADWLRTPPEEGTPAAAAVPAATPEKDLSDMSPDEALKWLEGLALEQGADPAEMVSLAGEAAPGRAEPPVHEDERAQQPAALPTASQEMPDWLQETAAALPAEPEAYQPQPAQPEAAAPAAEKDLSGMSADEALKWLETLALQQGGRPEEMVSGVEPGAAEVKETQPPAAQTPPEEMPDWLQETAAALPAEPEAYQPQPVQPGAAAPAKKDLSEMSADEALKWLETLALQQGGNPDEMVSGVKPGAVVAAPAISQPERAAETAPAEPAEELPAWLAGSETAAPQAPAAPGQEIPEWAKPAAPERARAPEPKPAPGGAPSSAAEDEKLARLAEKLSAARRHKDEDIARRFAEERRQREEARRAVQDKMETKRRTTSLGTGPLDTSAPGAGTSASGRRPETGSLPEPAQAPQVIYLPAPKVEPKPKASPKPKAPVRPRGKAARSVYAKQPAEETLAQARQRLGDGDREGSAEAFAYLVNTSQFLDEIIAELEAFTGASRGASPLLQVLGDAYMKNDRLQKALDTYRRALEEL